MERRVLVAESVYRPLLFLVLASCSDHASQAAPPTVDAHIKTRWSQLQLAPVARATPRFTNWLPARVAIDEARAARIGPPIGGRVTDVWVERGQHVSAGDRLFAIASGELAALHANRGKAEVELATARSTLDRTRILVDAQSLPGKELIMAQQSVAEAELALKTSASRIGALHLRGGVVVAPRTGTIVEQTVAIGQQVSPSDPPAVAIADLGTVWVIGEVLDGEVGNLSVGTIAEVRVSDDAPPIAAVVDQVSAVVDPDRHTIQVRVQLPNPTGALRPNLHAELRVFDDDGDLVAPEAAVQTDGAHSYVYVRTGDAIARREVVAGPAEDGVRSIHRGLVIGEELVTRGATLLDNQLDQELPR